MRAVIAGARFQLWRLRRNLDELQSLVLAPLFALIFGGVVVSSGRRDLLTGAILGAALMALWMLCVQVGGGMIEQERWQGTFEQLESSPASLRLIVAGRVTAASCVSLLVLPEVWLVAWLAFSAPIRVPHPGLLAISMLLTLVGLHAAATLFGGLFVLARSGAIVQNALAYPVFLLGGLLVPVSVLPGWLQPVSRLIFLSWGSDLLRTSLRAGPAGHVGTSIVGLAVTSLLLVVAGQVIFGIVVNRARVRGTLSLA